MSATPLPEAAALQAALSTLLSSTSTGGALARQARVLCRAADDAEVTAAECPDVAARHALMEQVNAARGAAAEARRQARATALLVRRDELLAGAAVDDVPKDGGTGAASGLAKEINDGLRRATAVVGEEVTRSQAAGKVVEESSRRLRMTRDQHSRYGQTLGSGADTLSDIRRTELVANVAVVLSFVLFFFVAAYVAHRRVSNSYTASFLVRPIAKVFFAPVRIMTRIFAFVLRKPVVDPRVGVVDTRGSEADVKGKARKGRENDSSIESRESRDGPPTGESNQDAAESRKAGDARTSDIGTASPEKTTSAPGSEDSRESIPCENCGVESYEKGALSDTKDVEIETVLEASKRSKAIEDIEDESHPEMLHESIDTSTEDQLNEQPGKETPKTTPSAEKPALESVLDSDQGTGGSNDDEL